jgi:hypothetical protein
MLLTRFFPSVYESGTFKSSIGNLHFLQYGNRYVQPCAQHVLVNMITADWPGWSKDPVPQIKSQAWAVGTFILGMSYVSSLNTP